MAEETNEAKSFELLEMTADIVAAYVGKANLGITQISEVITAVYTSLSGLQNAKPVTAAEPEVLKAAVPVRRSVTPDYIICLEDGKKLRMLKRHLRTTYGLSPEEYRTRWNLPNDYPMVAPNYTKQRSDFAKKIGLGRGTTTRKGGKRKAS